MWTSLPQVKQLLALGWHRHLPAEAGTTFMSVAILWWTGCKGKEMWHWLETWHSQAADYEPDPRQACAKEDVERRFREEYGKTYRSGLRGMLEILVELGLIRHDTRDGEEAFDIPDLLPLPEYCLRLSNAEKAYLTAMRQRALGARDDDLPDENDDELDTDIEAVFREESVPDRKHDAVT